MTKIKAGKVYKWSNYAGDLYEAPASFYFVPMGDIEVVNGFYLGKVVIIAFTEEYCGIYRDHKIGTIIDCSFYHLCVDEIGGSEQNG